MVRIVSQNFSPPRSRHSSGETDWDLAERTKLALSSLGRKRVDTPEWESSSDSFWDSEFDFDHGDAHLSEADSEQADINGNDPSEKSDAQSKRKQRRRERNKISAQAYRQRRRHQNNKEKEQLMSLEFENKRLHKLVESLEKKTEQAKQYLRGISVPMPDILSPVGEEGPPDFPDEGQACAAVASAEPSSISQIIPPHNKNTEPSLPHPSIQPFHNPESPFPPSPQTQLHTQNLNTLPGHQLQLANHTHLPTAQPKIQENLNLNVADATVPTYHVTLPLEHPTQCMSSPNMNSMPNINQGNVPLAASSESLETVPEKKWADRHHHNHQQTAVITGATASPVLAAEWAGINGNPVVSLNNNAVFSIVKMEMCNNGNVSITSNHNENTGNLNHLLINDNNGNQNNLNTMTMKAINPQILSFKINLNHTTGPQSPQPSLAELGSQQFGLVSLSQATTAPSGNPAEKAMHLHVQ